MQRYFSTIVVLFILMIYGCSGTPRPIMHKPACDHGVYAIKGAQCLEYEGLLDKLEAYPVLFIGDHHNSVESLDFTASLISGLQDRGYKVHLGNEWFVPSDLPILQAYLRNADEVDLEKAIGWKEKAGYDFSRYASIYEAVRKGGGTLHGINLTKAFKTKISDLNTSGMSDVEKVFVAGLDLNVSAHRQLLAPFFSHCHNKREGESAADCARRMYRVQVAWDSMMAQESAKLASKLLKSPEDRLLIFVGAMHLSHGLGANMRFARLSDKPYVTLLPEISSPHGYENDEADYLYLYTPKDVDR